MLGSQMMYTVSLVNTFCQVKSALIFLYEYNEFQHNPLGCTARNCCIDDQYSDQ